MTANESDTQSEPGDDSMEFGRWLFAQECLFVRGVVAMDQLPAPSLEEIAFAGRSNVGKSSLINALTRRKTLARTSNTPGRTREINFFDLGGRLMIVDLPGYGYARASKAQVQGWTQLIHDYLRGRPNLRRVCLLIDGRHGLKDSDLELMSRLDSAAVTYQIVLTKCDKVAERELAHRIAAIESQFPKHPAAYPQVLATSARSGTGIGELRAALAALAVVE